MQNVVPSIGSTCLGIVIGWLVRFFIWRFKQFSPSVLSAVVSVILGGAVAKYLGPTNDPNVWWFYPIGLLVGFVVYHILATLEIRRAEKNGGGVPILNPVLLYKGLESDSKSQKTIDI